MTNSDGEVPRVLNSNVNPTYIYIYIGNNIYI